MSDPARNGVFGIAPGRDFAADLVAGMQSRMQDAPPEEIARVWLIVNTRRMARRVKEVFSGGGPGFLPRVTVLSDIGSMVLPDAGRPVSRLKRRLDLAQLVGRLLDANPQIASRDNLYDLSDSLASLVDEMEGEGVPFSALRRLDVGDHSAHWGKSLEFLSIVDAYLAGSGADMGPERRQAEAVEKLVNDWTRNPPSSPVIVAGSTGSRATTRALMAAVSQLPQGFVVLPGFDFEMDPETWRAVWENGKGQDHPQFRFADFAKHLGMSADSIGPWTSGGGEGSPRTKLVSLALRPAPVTRHWLRDGPTIADLPEATEQMSLIEAPSERAEAMAIAVCLRRAHEDGKTAALISPDRIIGRRVTAYLDRWGLVPDDSAGRPLALSAPGRFLRHVAALLAGETSCDALLALLKHPIAHSGDGRGSHLIHVRELEIWARKNHITQLDARTLSRWPRASGEAGDWVAWLSDILTSAERGAPQSPSAWAEELADTAVRFSAGAGQAGSGALWEEAAGREAFVALREITDAGAGIAPISAPQFAQLLSTVLNDRAVRDPVQSDGTIMIWGTLEARVQGADLVILAGLNEGTWPATLDQDPWLNRAMRRDAGLLLPERQIGLAAHDFQQGICAKEVILSRAARTADREPVPSRWLNRIKNLLEGLHRAGSPDMLGAMQARGNAWIDLATALEQDFVPVPREPRPSPRPPVAQRPRQLSVTAVTKLVRDPFEIYARHILRLPSLPDLQSEPTSRLRGELLHAVFERFGKVGGDAAALSTIARAVFAENVPWPAVRVLWQSTLDELAEWFVASDASRDASIVAVEARGTYELTEFGFTLTGIADRIDRLADGRLAILDYKTGTPPSKPQIVSFDRQLILEALIAENGGFKELDPSEVAYVAYYKLGSDPFYRPFALEEELSVPQVRADLATLIRGFSQRGRGYTARRAAERTAFEGDYDHLSRRGEWDINDLPRPEDVE